MDSHPGPGQEKDCLAVDAPVCPSTHHGGAYPRLLVGSGDGNGGAIQNSLEVPDLGQPYLACPELYFSGRWSCQHSL